VEIPALGDQPPHALGIAHHRQHRERTEHDHVPGAVIGEQLAQQEEDHRPDDRALQRAEPADDDDEDGVGGPVDRERRVRRDAQQREIDQRAGHAGAERRDQVDHELGAKHVDTQVGV
jgi:hypothetical protein